MPEADDVQKKLLADRVVALFGPLDDAAAERAIGQILYLEELDAEKELTLSLSAPGGSIIAGLSILQTLGQLGTPVRTVCLDRCGGVATLLLAAGARGSRTARQGARISLDDVSAGNVTDLALEPLRRKLIELLAAFTGQAAERIAQDVQMGLELTAEGARRYGIVDEVFVKDARPA